MLREIILLRKLTSIKENAFTTKLVDIILPEEILFEESKRIDEESEYDHTKLNRIFLVLEYIESDFKKMLSSDPPTHLEDKHIVTLLYNSLCALHFIHSANVIHRDLKPANMLMDS